MTRLERGSKWSPLELPSTNPRTFTTRYIYYLSNEQLSIPCKKSVFKSSLADNFLAAFNNVNSKRFAFQGMLDAVLRGLIKTHAQAEDVHVPQEMTNKMFMDNEVGFLQV